MGSGGVGGQGVRIRQSNFGRAAEGDERDRLWGRWREIDKDLDALAARRSGETAVVVLAPRD